MNCQDPFFEFSLLSSFPSTLYITFKGEERKGGGEKVALKKVILKKVAYAL